MASDRTRGGGAGEHSHHAAPSVLEWIAAAVGAAAVVAAIAFLSYEAATTGPHPVPRLAVRPDTTIAYRTGYLVEFRVVNEGEATAARVAVLGELRSDTGVVERAEAMIDFVPARSFRSGGLVFTNDPRRYRIELRPVGFDRP